MNSNFFNKEFVSSFFPVNLRGGQLVQVYQLYNVFIVMPYKKSSV